MGSPTVDEEDIETERKSGRDSGKEIRSIRCIHIILPGSFREEFCLCFVC